MKIKMNTDMLMKIFLVVIVLSLLGYLIYAIVANDSTCKADNFKNNMKGQVNSVSNFYNKEGFQNGEQVTLRLYFANWCPHCKRWMQNGRPTSQCQELMNACKSMCTVEEPLDCAGSGVKCPSWIRGYPSWVCEMGNKHVDVDEPTVDGVRAAIRQLQGN